MKPKIWLTAWPIRLRGEKLLRIVVVGGVVGIYWWSDLAVLGQSGGSFRAVDLLLLILDVLLVRVLSGRQRG